MSDETLKNMVLSFRVSELQMLLGFAGRNKSGRKTELQARAVDLLRMRSAPVQMKIRDLYKSIQHPVNGPQTVMQMQQQSSQQQPPPNKEMTPLTGPVLTQSSQHQPPRTTYQTSYAAPDSRQVQAIRGYDSRGSANMYPMFHHPPPYPPKASPPAPAPASFPIHPDVKLKKLPFYDQLGELLKPSSLSPHPGQRIQESNFVFHLTPQQATDISTSRDILPGSKMEFVIQVQMRFCLLETSCEQDDYFPPGLGVKVNGKICPLPNPIPTNKPNVEPKRPPRPINITPIVRLSPTIANMINVSWNAEYGRAYVIAVYLVRKLTSSELLQRLKTKGIRNSDFTRGLIKEKLNEDADSEIATTSLRVSLVCPLGKMRMTTPCRASTCYHLQCFDASLYLQMNERKPTWMCPVCDKPALYDNLVIDGYFQQVLASSKLPIDGNEIQLHQDGSWSSLIIKKEQTRVLSPALDCNKSVEKIDSDDLVVLSEEKCEKSVSIEPDPVPEPSAKKNESVIDLTVSDSDEEEEDCPVVPKKKLLKFDPKINSFKVSDSTSVSSTGSSSSLSVTTSGSVTSSGYLSPSVITLDSPSPPPPSPSPVAPAAPAVTTAAPPAAKDIPPLPSMNMQSPYLPQFLDLDSDSNSPQSATNTIMYNRY